jgi:hypothetical protein
MKLSKHAIKRIRQRVGVRTKKRARQIGYEALRKGIPPSRLPDNIKDFIDENCHGARSLVYNIRKHDK